MYAIEAKNLTKKFGEHLALDEFSLKVRRNEIFGLLGPNGAGKTTFIKILCSLLKKDSGKLYVLGYDIPRDSIKIKGRIGVVTQISGADLLLTVNDNLDFYSKIYGVSRKERRERIQKALEFMEIEDQKNKPVMYLSGGEKRRLALAKAFIHEPELLILDEPTTGVDLNLRKKFWEWIKKLNEKSCTIFLTTHYTEEAESVCDRVSIIDKGRNLVTGDVSDLKNKIKAREIIELKTSKISDDVLKKINEIDGILNVVPRHENIPNVYFFAGKVPKEYERLRKGNNIVVDVPVNLALSLGAEGIKKYIGETKRKILREYRSEISFKIYTNGESSVISPLIELLNENKVTIKSLNVKKPSLEEVFIYYTRRCMNV